VRLVLASASPRRADLLRAAGFDFVVRPAQVDERVLAGETPSAHVMRLARTKAAACATDAGRGSIVLAADTVVVVNYDILGKPCDDSEAASMLRRLSGRGHRVLTGVTAQTDTDVRVAVDETEVWFEPLTPADIAWYVASGEPRDKAGAYAIQGRASRFISHIAGSYTNVVGLPIHVVWRLVRELDRDSRG
jgi:septum formation protein